MLLLHINQNSRMVVNDRVHVHRPRERGLTHIIVVDAVENVK